MTPTAEMSRAVWRAWLKKYEQIVVGPGWDGTHTPLQATWRAEIKTLAKRNAARGLVSAFWLEGDNDGDDAGSTFPSWDELTAGTMRLFDELRDVDGWKILGISYDVQERKDQDEVNRWLTWCRANAPEGWLFCARALPDRRYAGDVASWEDHLPEPATMDAILLEEIERSEGRPLWNTERNRARNNGKGKDTTQKNMPAMIRIARERNVGLIMGIEGPAGSVSDYGSKEPQRPAAFRDELVRQADVEEPEEPELPEEPNEPPEDPPAPPGPTIEDIMSILTPFAPLIDAGFELAGKALEHDTAKDAHDLALLELMTATQREKYLDQIMRDRERRAKNLDWWQVLFDNASDLIDGDAWKRLREEFEEGAQASSAR